MLYTQNQSLTFSNTISYKDFFDQNRWTKKAHGHPTHKNITFLPTCESKKPSYLAYNKRSHLPRIII